MKILPRLVVVTFANRAADEMQQRARQVLLEDNLGAEVQTAFNRAFFGTIHSFCMKLLTDFGHYLGLPAPLELLSDDDDLWAGIRAKPDPHRSLVRKKAIVPRSCVWFRRAT